VNRLKFVASEAWRSITANVSTTFAAVLTVLVGMALVGMMVGFGTYARSWTAKTKKELVVKVFFCTDETCPTQGYATKKQINAVARRAQANPLVKSVRFVSREEAFREMKRLHPELVASVPSNPLPDALTVRPVKGEDTQKIYQSLNPYPKGVQGITYGKKTTHKILNVAHLIEVLFLVAVIILLAASTVLIANTIRLSIFARRREVEVMKLVGASNWFVRGPFMLEGLVTGFVGALLAVILLLVGKEFVISSIWFKDRAVHALPFALNALILVGLGLLLGAAGSGLTLRRFLKI
jgi:cell division transport system permease protein